jgi:hypothetical protein
MNIIFRDVRSGNWKRTAATEKKTIAWNSHPVDRARISQETLIGIYQTTRHYIPGTVYSLRHEHLKFRTELENINKTPGNVPLLHVKLTNSVLFEFPGYSFVILHLIILDAKVKRSYCNVSWIVCPSDRSIVIVAIMIITIIIICRITCWEEGLANIIITSPRLCFP